MTPRTAAIFLRARAITPHMRLVLVHPLGPSAAAAPPGRGGRPLGAAAGGGLDAAAVVAASEEAMRDDETRLLADVAWNAGLRPALLDHRVLRQGVVDAHVFSHELAPRMTAADQRHTGLCWAFAGLGLLRRRLALAFDLPADFQLSEGHVLFHDKLEKANAFLRNVAALDPRAPADDRRRLHLLADPVPDGGGFHTFARLVRKYGVVPAAAMPRSANAEDTLILNRMLALLLRRAAARLARAAGDARAREEVVEDALRRVHRLLCVSLGAPPREFTWTFRSRTRDEGRDDGEAEAPATTEGRVFALTMTPRALYEEHCPCLHAYANLVHVPHRPEPTPHAYEVEYIDSVRGPAPSRFIAVAGDVLRRAVVASLLQGCPVWVACEFDQLRLRGLGLLHHELVQHERAILEPQEGDDKAARIEERRCDPNHAILLTGMHVVDGEVVRFQVENSHGVEDKDGYLSMTREWFDRHVLGAAVPPDPHFEPRAPPTVLPPWDVLGFVAQPGPS